MALGAGMFIAGMPPCCIGVGDGEGKAELFIPGICMLCVGAGVGVGNDAGPELLMPAMFEYCGCGDTDGVAGMFIAVITFLRFLFTIRWCRETLPRR